MQEESPSPASPQQPDPWVDFFGVYLDLGYALHGEFQRDETLKKDAQQLELLLQKIRCGDPHSEWHRDLVHEVIKRFRGKSKEILFQEPSYFDQPLLLYPSIDGIDIAKLWGERPLYRDGLWQWLEQLYVIGNVCLHPNRKDKFLNIVRQLKQMKRGEEPTPTEEPEENLDEVVKGIAGMMGMGDNPAMQELMGDMTKHMHQVMTKTDNPMALLQTMMSGDMSVLGGLQEEMEQKIQQKMQTGELTEQDFQRQREGMVQNFGGMDGLMQMASGMGLQVPATEEGEEINLEQTMNAALAAAQNEGALTPEQLQFLQQQQQQRLIAAEEQRHAKERIAAQNDKKKKNSSSKKKNSSSSSSKKK